MAMLTAKLTQTTAGGITDPLWAADLYRRESGAYPSDSLVRPGGAAIATHWPVEANGRPISATRLRSYQDEYYYRIHIAPQQLDLGNVASTQTTAVSVWNAYLEPRTLTTLDGLSEGLQSDGQLAPPLLFNGLQERTWQVSVTQDGQPVLDTSLSWKFDNGASASLRITATRIIAWAFAPDWADGVLERLTWATDILQSESGVEQRRALRLAPRRELEASLYVDGRERQMLDLALFGWGARTWALPIWPDVQLLATAVPVNTMFIACQTGNLDFLAGGLALLRGEQAWQYETVEILQVQPSGLQLKRATQQAWAVGSRLYPARSAQLAEQPSLTRLTDQLQSLDVKFLINEPCDWVATLPATLYRGRPVLEARPDESEDLTSRYQRLLRTLDSGLALPLTTDSAGQALLVQGYRWQALGRSERANYRALLYALRGRQVPVWVPTHAADLTLVAAVTAVATTLDIEHLGYTRFGQSRPGRRDLRIELVDGTVFHRRITGSSELSGEVERLAIDSALGKQIALGDVLRISWMALCRLDSDTVEIEHITDSEGVAKSALVFRGVRDDEF